MKHPGRRTLVVGMTVAALGTAPAMADTIRVQGTTDTVDAGLVEGLLQPEFEKGGDTLKYTPVGTGKALDNARTGVADVVITHAPTLEKKFQDDGFSLEGPGRAIFYSDYVIVGPKSDPAGVKAAANHDAVAAFEKIAAATAAGGPAQGATFISRGDNSGTNVQEQLMWHLTGADVVKQKASNAGSATDRDEPGTGGTNPAWYKKTTLGQAASLQKADACAKTEFPTADPDGDGVGNCYTIVDRGTFNRLDASGTITKLAVLSENNAEGVRGGKDLLINPFSAYIVNPDKFKDNATTFAQFNVPAAKRLLDFLTSPAFQARVDTFPSTTNPAFRGDAFPSVAIDSALPATATTGTAVSVGLTLRNKQPGAQAVDGQPVQLQSSTDDGVTWTNVGTPVATDASGRVAFTPTVVATARYRVSTERFTSTIWNAFSPSTQEIGAVTAVAPATVTPAPVTPVPVAPKPTPAKKDRVAAKASGLKATRRRLTLKLNEAGSVKVTLARRTVKRVRRSGKVRSVVSYRTAKVVRGRAKKAGTVRLSWKNAIRAGTYRVTVRSVDAAGNVRTQTRRVVVKR